MVDICALRDPPASLTFTTQQSARWLARDHGFSFDDDLIVAVSIEAGYDMLLSEAMQVGGVVACLRTVNPFV